jgi:hypothetical protein
MKHLTSRPRSYDAASYVVCRMGGAPPALAQSELRLTSEAVARLERLFQARPGGEGDAMKPRFARHGDHVRDALAAGGFPELERP